MHSVLLFDKRAITKIFSLQSLCVSRYEMLLSFQKAFDGSSIIKKIKLLVDAEKKRIFSTIFMGSTWFLHKSRFSIIDPVSLEKRVHFSSNFRLYASFCQIEITQSLYQNVVNCIIFLDIQVPIKFSLEAYPAKVDPKLEQKWASNWNM